MTLAFPSSVRSIHRFDDFQTERCLTMLCDVPQKQCNALIFLVVPVICWPMHISYWFMQTHLIIVISLLMMMALVIPATAVAAVVVTVNRCGDCRQWRAQRQKPRFRRNNRIDQCVFTIAARLFNWIDARDGCRVRLRPFGLVGGRVERSESFRVYGWPADWIDTNALGNGWQLIWTAC